MTTKENKIPMPFRAKQVNFSIEEAKQIEFYNQYAFDRNIDNKFGIEEVFKDYEIVKFVEAETMQCGGYYFNRVIALIRYKDVLLEAHPKSYGAKSYGFHLYQEKYINIHPDLRREVYDKLPEQPNYVGKPTERKMNEWLEFLLLKEQLTKEIVEESTAKKEAFIKKIEDTFGSEANWFRGERNQVEVYRGGLVLTCTIGANGDVYTQVKVSYKADTSVEGFIKMSDNKLGQ